MPRDDVNIKSTDKGIFNLKSCLWRSAVKEGRECTSTSFSTQTIYRIPLRIALWSAGEGDQHDPQERNLIRLSVEWREHKNHQRKGRGADALLLREVPVFVLMCNLILSKQGLVSVSKITKSERNQLGGSRKTLCRRWYPNPSPASRRSKGSDGEKSMMETGREIE